MTKIFLLLMLFSVPNAPSVKYTALIYFTEQECFIAKENYMTVYNNKSKDYLNVTKTNAYCIEFESFSLNSIGS
jgi:hypothetical protein|tara:strand:- start:107 stop:328 length:222 start_codon:yes stop_codon:yes gene_type:complete